MKKFKFVIKILLCLTLIAFLFPLIKIGSSTRVKPDYLFALLLNIVLFFNLSIVINNKLYKKISLIFIGIVISSIFSNYVCGFYYLPDNGSYVLPENLLLIANKIGVFIFFSYCVSQNIFPYNKIIIWCRYVFWISLCFGTFQFLDLFSAREVALKFFLDAGSVQEDVFVVSNRIIGTSPAVISWGGVVLIMFYFFLYLENSLFFRITGILMAVLNIVGTASRAAIFAFIGSFVLINLYKAIFIDKKLKYFLRIVVLLCSFCIVGFISLKIFLPDQVEFLEKRIGNTQEQITQTGRGEQMAYFFDVLNQDPIGYIFGVGYSVIVDYGYLEVDIAYILVSFGIVGFILHYLLLIYIFKEVYLLRKYNMKFYLFTISIMLGALIFSVGFYFFYEIYMGLPFWWILGIIAGYLWKLKKDYNNIYIV